MPGSDIGSLYIHRRKLLYAVRRDPKDSVAQQQLTNINEEIRQAHAAKGSATVNIPIAH